MRVDIFTFQWNVPASVEVCNFNNVIIQTYKNARSKQNAAFCSLREARGFILSYIR